VSKLASLLPAGGKREREGKEEKPFTPSPRTRNGTPYAGWWRVRERKRKGGKVPLQRERTRAFKIPYSSFLYLESLSTGTSDCFCQTCLEQASWQGSFSYKSPILLRACLFHPCVRVLRWDADPKC
jgi:hypothetical protein